MKAYSGVMTSEVEQETAGSDPVPATSLKESSSRCDGFWRYVRGRTIATHSLDLIHRKVDGLDQYEIVVDCITQFRGSLLQCEGQWRQWVRKLNAAGHRNEESEKGEVK